MSLGRDLSTIRKEKKLTLEDVHSISKIPIYTLQSIEQDSFLNQTKENKTYLRSFVRSYAKALKISDEHILIAIDATEAGIYNNDLLKLVHPEFVEEEFSLKKDQVEVSELDESAGNIDEDDEEIIEEPAETISSKKERDPKVPIDPVQARFHQVTPTIDTINWGEMSRKIHFNRTNPKVFFAIFFAIVILGGAFAIYYNLENIKGLFDSEADRTENVISSKADKNPVTPPAADTLDALPEESNATFIDEPLAQVAASNVDVFGDTLEIILYAAYDKLDPVRVTSDFNGRTNPFWLDAGQASYFQFRDTLLIRGQFSKMLLLFNNHVIENPRQNYYNAELNSVMLTREILEGAKYSDTVGSGYPLNVLPPDSIEYLIRY
ncbi:MAG: helix-turn-helix domain-containing protein [Balneolaceae bacterium]